MSRSAFPLLCTFLCGISAAGQSANSNCPELTVAERARISRHAERKYKVRSALEIEASTPIGTGCYRKLDIRYVGTKQPRGVKLYLSPDHLFLSNELLDTRLDPLAAEIAQRRRLESGMLERDVPGLGTPSAPVIITVFSDFQCPYCARFAYMVRNDILPFETGRVRVVFRHFPLANHNWARAAAEATACAGEQKNEFFWRLHYFIFERQNEFTPANVATILSRETNRLPGFDHNAFDRCVKERRSASKIDRDASFAREIDVQGTPTVFVNSRRITNIAGPEHLRSLIRELAEGGANRDEKNR